MKKILLVGGLAASLLAGFNAGAQVHINVQLGMPVVRQNWYANDNDYYYMPEQGVYYNVRRRVYVYPENGSWLYAERLPARYGTYNFRSSHYVRVHDRTPFDRDNDYRMRYHGGYTENRSGWNGHDRGHWDNGHRGNDHDRGRDDRGHDDRGHDDRGHDDRGHR